MSLTLSAKQSTSATQNQKIRASIRLWLCTWELVPILLVAATLRLGGLNTTTFAGDQSVLYTLAYDAVHHGLIPTTSNSASIFTMHPPLAIYFLMLPVFFSANPLWAAVMTALFNVVAVLLAYIFTRRYYGRLAATIAALLFATAQTSIVFSRFIWQPTLLSPFVILFLFALFRGVVERKKGWLLPALVLLGIMYQLHEITLLMAPLLIVALLLVPCTIRLRDFVLGFVCLLLIFTPYLVWELHSKFADIHTLLALTNAHAHLDSKAITYYQRFLNAYYYDDRVLGSTYYDPVGSGDSIVFRLLPLLILARYMLTFLLLAAFAMAGIMIVYSSNAATQAISPAKKPSHISLLFTRLFNWWTELRADPFRCGLILLVLWQIVPVLALSRHSATIHLHYLLMILPGQFILIGFFLSRAISWFQLQQTTRMWQIVRYGIALATTLLLVTQLAGSTASLLDTTRGINNHIFGYNDLGSLQHALQEADQVAQTHHLNRVYITISLKDDSLTALPYLAEQMHTPSTLFDATACLVLPSLASGPAVLLMRSTDTLGVTLLRHFATITLVDKPPLLGTSPFLLYIVTPTLLPTSTQHGFANHLQLLAPAQLFMQGTTPFLATHWTLLNNAQPGSFKTYTYTVRAKSTTPYISTKGTIRSDCLFTAIRAHDQLIASFPLPHSSVPLSPSSFSITAQFLTTSPYTFAQGPFRFETYRTTSTLETLHTLDGSNTLTLASTTTSSPSSKTLASYRR
ncbi:MAG: ArnT family glycosyltransferase [Ktedonobacteraceae bacterium]